MIPVVKAGISAAAKALDDRPEREMLQRLAADSPNMATAAELYSRRVAVKEALLLRIYRPLARFVGVSRNYFDTDFATDMAAKLAEVPDENLMTPPPSVAIPTIEGLSYSIDEPALKDMYLNLLATATDDRISQRAHPSFAEIIKQLSPAEASLLLDVLRMKGLAVCRLTRNAPEGPGFSIVCTHLVNVKSENSEGPVRQDDLIAIWMDNWVRLGLITVDYGSYLVQEGVYDWVSPRREYVDAIASDDRGEASVNIDKGMASPTEFGKQFFRAVSFDGTAIDYPIAE